MKFTEALRWAIYYRGLSLLSFLLGWGIIILGLWLAFSESLSIIMSSKPLTSESVVENAVQAANVPLAVAFSIVGLFIWRIGKAAALYKTETEAIESELKQESEPDTGDQTEGEIDDEISLESEDIQDS